MIFLKPNTWRKGKKRFLYVRIEIAIESSTERQHLIPFAE